MDYKLAVLGLFPYRLIRFLVYICPFVPFQGNYSRILFLAKIMNKNFRLCGYSDSVFVKYKHALEIGYLLALYPHLILESCQNSFFFLYGHID